MTLVELMVAVVLFSVVMTGLIELLVSNSKNAMATSSLSRIQETGRTAVQLLTNDIRRAGYLGGNIGLDITGSLGEATPSNTCPSDNTYGTMVRQPVAGLNDHDPFTINASFDCITNATPPPVGPLRGEYLRGDVITLRFASSLAVKPDDMISTRPYIRTSLVEGTIFEGKDAVDDFEGEGAEDAEDAEETNNLLSDPTSRNYALVAHTYYVGSSGRSCQGPALPDSDDPDDWPVPALFRKSISDTGVPTAPQELLAGVEHLQFKYQVGNQYVDANAVTDWADVGAIETTILVRTECPETGFTNDRTFAIGDLASEYGPTDGYRRQVFTIVTSVRNHKGST